MAFLSFIRIFAAAMNTHTIISGLTGSAKAFEVMGTFQKEGGQHLVICADKEGAAYFYNDLEALLGERNLDYSKKQILFYPTSYKRPYEPERPDNTYILSRTEVLQRVSTSERKTVIVTYPEALSEKVCTRKLLARNTFKLRRGDQVNLDFLTDLLYEYGFENVDFVVEPGQFAVRGGLIDVFSFANDYPYRIEFFGDEVDSIRSFDIANQLSLERLNQIVLLPNMQQQAFIEERESILQYLPKATTVWVEEMRFFAEQIDKEYDRAVEAWEKMEEGNAECEMRNAEFAPGKMFAKAEELIGGLRERNTIEFQANQASSLWGEEGPVRERHTSPQPVFNKNFDFLLDDIKSYREKGYRVILYSESPKQLDRIQAILSDLQHLDELHSDFERQHIAIHAGFIDHDNKICRYTDHQIFERYHRYHLRDNFSSKQAITLKELSDLKPGDYVTHIDHGIGRFEGLVTIECNGKPQEVIRLTYNHGDTLYISVHSLHQIAKYSSKDGAEPTLSTLGPTPGTVLSRKPKAALRTSPASSSNSTQSANAAKASSSPLTVISRRSLRLPSSTRILPPPTT